MNRIKQLRTSNNLTLKQLSQKLDNKISPDALAKYERGEREPKIDKWQILAKYFGVSVPYLRGATTYEFLDHNEKSIYDYVSEAMNRAFKEYALLPKTREKILKAIAYSIDYGEFI